MSEEEETALDEAEENEADAKRGPKEDILIVTDKGFGIRTSLSEFKIMHRGRKGTRAILLNEKNGHAIGVKQVKDGDLVFLLSAMGQGNIIEIDDVKWTARARTGITLMKLDEGDQIIAIA